MRRFVAVSVVLSCCGLAAAQNLLVNPSFTDPPVTSACGEDWQDVEGWSMTAQSSPSGSGERRNGDFKSPPCPHDGDGAHASLQGWGFSNRMIWQTVGGLTPGQHYKLSGIWFYGADFLIAGGLTVSAELRSGSDPSGGSLLASTSASISNASTTMWLPFQTCGQLAGGSEVTVVLKASYTSLVGWAFHVDDITLEAVDSCVEPNRVESISPDHDVRGNTANATITGFDFTRGPITARLTRPGAADIVATNVQVSSPTVMTCRFNLANAPNGRWNVVVGYGSGSPTDATLPNGFMVVLPTLSNGSFENPTAAGGCPATPLSGHPTDWLVSHAGSWGDAGYASTTVVRDRSDVFTPTCPPPDGVHYASTYSVPPAPDAQPESWAYQTIVADPTKTYTVSGFFAGAGNNTVTLDLLDGTEQAAQVAGTTGGLVHDNGPQYDWSFAYVQGKPSGNLMTIRWRVSTRNPGPHVAHADALRIDVCSGEVTAASITPGEADNSGPLTGAEVLGTGFTGGGAPQVILTGAGLAGISATNVVVHSDTRLTCDFDLTGQLTGLRNLVVFREGCVAELPQAFLVVGGSLANGDFELPDPGVPVNCATPDGLVRGVPAGWTVSLTPPGSFDRDHHVLRPATCPSSAGGHYGSLTSDRTGDLIAYQTLRVTPTAGYTFGGRVAGGGPNQAKLLLMDGAFETGTLLAEAIVNEDAAGGAYDWRRSAVSAFASSGIMTAVIHLDTLGEDLHAMHVDGLSLAMSSDPCHQPFADADSDGDVDPVDFAHLQRCYSYGAEAITSDDAYCRCFDRNGDGDVDLADAVHFIHCAGGANAPPDPACTSQ